MMAASRSTNLSRKSRRSMPDKHAKQKNAGALLENVQQNGSFVFANGDTYEGTFRLTEGTVNRDGEGVHITPGGLKYEGSWANDKMNGRGRLEFQNGAVYEGGFCDNKFQGQGTYTWPNGSFYEGDFVENKLVGKGEFTDTDAQIWSGNFSYKAAPGLRFKLGS